VRHESLSNFTLTGPVFLLAPNQVARTLTNSSLYSMNTKLSFMGF